MKPRRTQSNDLRVQSAAKKVAIQGGYTVFTQNGCKFDLPNVKMSSQRNIQEIESRIKRQQHHPTSTESQTRPDKKFSTLEPPLTNALIMSKTVNYRIAQPYSSTIDMNARLWESSMRQTKGLKRVQSAVKHDAEMENMQQLENEKYANYNDSINDDKYTIESDQNSGSKPYQFLSQLGGKMLSQDYDGRSLQTKEVTVVPHTTQRHRPMTGISTISKIDLTALMIENKQKQQQRVLHSAQAGTQRPPISKRPMTSTQLRPQAKLSGNERIQSATLNLADQQQLQPQQQQQSLITMERPKSSWISQRPISANVAAPQSFFQTYTKYTNFSALDSPYEELFDRNERTVGATFAKFGDLGYYSPIQRIGMYMQYSAKLTMANLLKIIDLQKTSSNVEKNENEVPIQLAIIDDLYPSRGRDKTGVNSGADDAFTREPVTLSLYPEYFDDNDEKITQMELSMRLFQEMLDEMGGYYDPAMLGKQNYMYIDESDWSESIMKQVGVSQTRYAHYINSDMIRQNEVPKFKKQWLVRACSLITEKLLQNEECSRTVFQEIFESFKIAMKQAMLDYILRSPEERKRLHITMIPRQFTHSGQRIGREGGFNIRLFPEWHEYVERGKLYCQQNLTLISTITSSMQDWIQDFNQLNLCELTIMKQVAKLGYTFTLPEFSRIQTIYKLNLLCLLENVWFRGVMSIIKQGKYLRFKNQKSTWTINGPKLINNMNTKSGQFAVVHEESENDSDQDDQQDPLIYQGIGKPCFISAQRAIQFYEDRTRQYNQQKFRDSCQALTAYHEYHIKLINPNPIDPQKISEYPLDELKYHSNEKPYKKLEKEQRQRVIENAATLIQLQLRQIVERSLNHFEQHILNTELYTGGNLRINKEDKFTSLIQMSSIMKDRQFEKPHWDLFEQELYPFIKIDIIVEQDAIKFRETEEIVRTEITDIYRNIIISFDKFLHPKYAKSTTINTQPPTNKSTMRSLQFNFDSDMGGMTKEDFEKFFKSFWPQIKVSEKQEKEHPELLLASDEQKHKKQESKHIQVAQIQEYCFIQSEDKLLNHVNSHYQICQNAIKLFDQFLPFVDKSVDKDIKAMLSRKQMSNEEFKTTNEILNKYLTLLEQFPTTIQFPLFQVNCEIVIKWLKTTINDCKDKVFNKFESILIELSRVISDRYIQISTYIRKSLKTPEDVEAMEKYLADVQTERTGIKVRSTDIFIKVMFLLKQDFTISETLLQLSEDLYHKPTQLDKDLIEQEEKHAIERSMLEDALRSQRSIFEERVAVYCEDLHKFEAFTEKAKYKNYIEIVDEFEAKLAAADKEMADIVTKEYTLFGYASTFDNFIKMQKDIQPYSEMWRSIGLFMECKKKWNAGPIKEVDSSDVESILKAQQKCSIKMIKAFKSSPIAFRVASEFKDDIELMNEHMPAIELLSNPGLKERHWNQINMILGTQFTPNEVTLKELLINKVEEHLPQMEEISENASKEFALENALNKMIKEWESQKLVIINFKNRGVMILQGQSVEDVQSLLDEHTIKAQTIRANPQIKFMEEQAIKWEQLMFFIQEMLDLWVKVQGMYLYLEPIFSFEDIMKTLFEEYEKFQKVSVNWNMIMKAVELDPLALNLENIPDLKETLLHSLKMIEEIQKGLENHLEIKRLEFPRFFFLSNDDLINILAETRDPMLVQPHMRKCFEGIEELIFNSNAEILGMKSVEKEEVQFDNRVIPKEFQSNVEKWLLKVEEEMQVSLSHQMRQCYAELLDYPNMNQWIKKWPGQCILGCACLNFTHQVEETIVRGMTLNRFGNERTEHLNSIVNMVRISTSNNERQILSALIVLEVHNNDILNELIRLEMRDCKIFEWTSQMRYYMSQESQVIVKMVYTSLDYAYEYLGIGSRLVITPLTDRCYRTLVCALQFNLGGAPEGPAGTGKTESVKDLAKAVAVQCIVFNCGEGLNAHAMAKFFKGLASAGAWSCFDEFNRIDLEVLSVIAQQILQIQQAKSQLKSKFMFEGTELTLLQSCNIFITMNPGYAGRSELPDNLKALFRPCAMMVPDYAMIAEISLYSFGFVEARQLAKKIVAVYKLCSEQLSSQDHYDYGMRAVKAVLTAAQGLKRRYPNDKEDVLIYRAISDINLPKFLTQDVMLFGGIMTDLFPEVKPPNVEYKALNDAMNNVLQNNKMQLVPAFKKKVLQLYEMVNCRHGLMIVGHTMSGKSACYQTLAGSLTFCNKNGTQDEKCVQYHVLNPKSVTLSQLYGFSDPVSKEWTEGVLGEIYRKCATSQSADRQFIVFDGPVDAEWIENMNTVLDDNKKLCLMSGETISMSDRMTIIFEVQDLLSASPATVSRCGMVYMQPDQLGWINIFLKELNHVTLDAQIIQRIQDLFEAIVDKCQKFIKQKCHEYESVPENAFAIQLLKLLVFQLKGVERYEEIKVDAMFLYSLIWTVGGSVDEVGRKHFDQYLKKLLKEPMKVDNRKDLLVKIEKQSQVPELSNTTSYDYYYCYNDGKWKNWKDKISHDAIPQNMAYQQILIETAESLRITSMISMGIMRESPILLIGPSGVGKTSYLRKYLSQLEHTQNLIIYVNFSATTSSTKTQAIIDSKLDRRKKGTYGPAIGVKGIIYVDDLNMPAPDKYGSQPPLELLRQLQDQKGWYGLDRQFMNIINTNLVGSMALPGGGRVAISQRFIRHFHMVSIVSPDNATIAYIFNSIIEWHLSKIMPGVDTDTKQIFEYAIDATIDLYNQIRDQLKPTPRKSWYFLNMRDISRIVQGITLVTNAKELMADNKKIQRLWLHETIRTFFDRLAEEDHEAFGMMLTNSIKGKLRDDLKQMMKPYNEKSTTQFGKLQNYLWSDVLSEELSPGDRQYEEMTSTTRILSKLQYYLDELNSNTKKPMNLALFEYALDHIIRILRVLTMQQGHLLLIGLGGSGRQSLTRLACHIREVEFVQIEVSKAYSYDQWKEDMQRLLVTSGVDNKETCFVLSDSHIRKPFILEDINNMLNTGEIPNLFPMEEFIPFIDKLRTKAKKEGRLSLLDGGTTVQFYDYFVESAKKKLHVAMAMSPIGDTLRSRIRMFPSIVNCTTIDCFHQWPEEALEAVARKFFHDLSLEHSAQRNLVAQCKYMHESLIDMSIQFKRVEGRHNYVTPSSYFELLKTFQSLLNTEKTKLDEMRTVYRNGVIKLNQTADEVKRMEEDLIEKQPLLIQMSAEAAQLGVVIQGQVDAMEPKKLQVQENEQEVAKCVREAELIEQDCERELAVAKPKLKQAEAALNTLSANDINSIKSMLKPPETVQLVMEAVCVLCLVPPMNIPNPQNPKERLLSYWEASKKFLTEKDFLQRLIQYDINNIRPEVMQKVRDKYVANVAVFNPKRVEKASSAAKGLCEWVLALNEYEKVLTIVRPKQQMYLESKAESSKLQASLKQTTEELEKLNQELQTLRDKHAEVIQKQKNLADDIKLCEVKLERASSLMGGLGGEKERWENSAIKYEQRLKHILGDLLLSSGVIAYLGVFSNDFRGRTQKLWLDRLKRENGLQYSDTFNLISIIGQPIQIRKWRMNGLPSDQFSIENGIIMYKCQRYPLLIDPQGQGNRFVKIYEQLDDKNNPKLKTVKLSDNDFLRNLDNAVQFGQTLLIENVGDDLDSSLDSILMKQIFKNAGVLSVKIGDNVVQYNKAFNLFITTKQSNPHYTPEISTKVTLINFTITQGGLEDQLLELCVMREQPNLEEEKNRQIVQQHKNQQELQKVEDQILQVLNNAENILDDEQGIEILQKSKEVSLDIEERQRVSEFTEKKTDEARIQYKPIAIHGSLLFFAVIAMAQLDTMYQYSLSWLLNLYQESFNKAETSTQIRNRINNVNQTMLNLIYNSVCRGLFEKDKLLFSFVILINILEQRKQIDFTEYSFVLKPILIPQDISDNPFKSWLSNQVWNRIQPLMKLSKKFQPMLESMSKNSDQWQRLLNDADGHQLRLPEPFFQITSMQRLCILKAMRPGKLPRAMSEFIASEIGEKFIQPPPFSLNLSYQTSNCHQPLLFILPGQDPMNALVNFAEQKQIQLRSVSLGQGQGIIADREIEEAKQSGSWVILQNCHLAPSWMSRLEKICEEISIQKVHTTFRLWLTSYPSEDLPATVIQSSIKMTNEPPNGIKSNLTVSYQSPSVQSLNFQQIPQQCVKLLYSMCFFHAILQERRNYGQIGFNIYYDFNQSDLFISIKQLMQMVEQSNNQPMAFNALHYLVGECNYGGKVTDERDRRVVRALLEEYMNSGIIGNDYKFGGLNEFGLPKSNTYEESYSTIQNLPSEQPCQLFGFHQNAEITRDLKYSDDLLFKLQLVAGSSYSDVGGGDESKKSDNVLKSMCEEYLAVFPKKFDLEIAQAKYPHDYTNSMNTVLLQEIMRYNRLIAVIHQSLVDLVAAFKGLMAMSEQLEKVSQNMLKGMVPEHWKKYSYPSLKPLGSYMADFLRRIKYFQTWIEKSPPYVHWISGFFFTQSFLTAVLQNHARKYSIAIDKLEYDFRFMEEPTNNYEINQLPRTVPDGTLIFGLYLEGCKWDYNRELIVESDAKVLTTLAPIIWLRPIDVQDIIDDFGSMKYRCPVYKTAERKGVLSTTGHSTNFIMNVVTPSDKQQYHWIKRGVAMLCQLTE